MNRNALQDCAPFRSFFFFPALSQLPWIAMLSLSLLARIAVYIYIYTIISLCFFLVVVVVPTDILRWCRESLYFLFFLFALHFTAAVALKPLLSNPLLPFFFLFSFFVLPLATSLALLACFASTCLQHHCLISECTKESLKRTKNRTSIKKKAVLPKAKHVRQPLQVPPFAC